VTGEALPFLVPASVVGAELEGTFVDEVGVAGFGM
jgi:hypothetical protein